MKNSILTFIWLIIFCGCSDNDSELSQKLTTISVDPEDAVGNVFLSEFVESIEFVKLETTKESFLGTINEIILRENLIYVSDQSQQAIFIFDYRGNFINKLSNQGAGPDQYRRLGPIFIDDSESVLEVMDFGGADTKILSYALPSLIYLESKSLDRVIGNSVRRKNGTYYVSTQQIENSIDDVPTNGDIFIVTESGSSKVLFDRKIPSSNSGFTPFTESFAHTGNDTILVSLMYRDTVFRLDDFQAFPHLIFDFGEYILYPEIKNLSTKDQLDIIHGNLENKVTFPVLNADNEHILAFSYYFKNGLVNDTHQYVKFKSNDKIFHTKQFVNDLTDFPNKIFISSYYTGIKHEIWYKDQLVDIILPIYSMDGRKEFDSEDLGMIKIEDNPIIALMKPKF